MPLADVACAILLTWNNLAGAGVIVSDTGARVDSTRATPHLTFSADTVRKPRPKAFAYSDGYATRLTIHRRLSWAMLPLFAASYFSGDALLKASTDGTRAPDWARNVHAPAATGSAVLFGANAITGSWNMWEGRGDPNGRTRRILHGVLFMAASGGFAYAGTKLANDAEAHRSEGHCLSLLASLRTRYRRMPIWPPVFVIDRHQSIPPEKNELLISTVLAGSTRARRNPWESH